MKWVLPAIVLLLGACTHLPTILPADADHRHLMESGCRSHFPQGRWQLVHAINVSLHGGRQATFTGVIVLSPDAASIHCVLMTLEGMVIFEAVDDGQVDVRRAFGPFDNVHFARGVLDDIHFLFLEPAGDIIATGTFDDGTRGCRYRVDHDRIVDLIQLADGDWQKHQYDQGGAVLRSVTAEAVNSDGVASRMILDAGGHHAYRLSMTLVEAIALP